MNKINDSDGYELKPIAFEDMEKIRQARNEQIEILRQSSEISKEEQKKYFYEVVEPSLKAESPKIILFSFFKNHEWIGYGGLVHIDHLNKRAEVSFLIETSRSKLKDVYVNDFTHFLKLLSKYAFINLKFHRLYTETFDFRDLHIQILENFGFKKEGVLRDHVFVNAKPHHSIMHGLLAKEFLNGL